MLNILHEERVRIQKELAELEKMSSNFKKTFLFLSKKELNTGILNYLELLEFEPDILKAIDFLNVKRKNPDSEICVVYNAVRVELKKIIKKLKNEVDHV